MRSIMIPCTDALQDSHHPYFEGHPALAAHAHTPQPFPVSSEESLSAHHTGGSNGTGFGETWRDGSVGCSHIPERKTEFPSRGGAPFAYNRDAALARGTALLGPRHHGPVLGIRAFKVHLVVFQSVMLKILLSRFRESSTSDSCPHCGPSQSNPQHVLCRDKALGIQLSQISA